MCKGEEALYSIKVDGNTINEKINPKPESFPRVKIYLSTPWLPSMGSHGTLSNLRITKSNVFYICMFLH